MVPLLERELMPPQRPFESLDLEFERVPFVSGAGAAVVMHAYFALRQRGLQLRLTRCSDDARRTLQICGILDLPGFDASASRAPVRSSPAA